LKVPSRDELSRYDDPAYRRKASDYEPRLLYDQYGILVDIARLLSRESSQHLERADYTDFLNGCLSIGVLELHELPAELCYRVAMTRNQYLIDLIEAIHRIQDAIVFETPENRAEREFFERNRYYSSELKYKLFFTIDEYRDINTKRISNYDILEYYKEEYRDYERAELNDISLDALENRREWELTDREKVKRNLLRQKKRRNKMIEPKYIENNEYLLKNYYEENKQDINRRYADKNNVLTVEGTFEDWKANNIARDRPSSSFFLKPISFHIPVSAFDAHAYITGASGSGKSELLKLIAFEVLRSRTGELADQSNLVVIDPHGDLADEIARLKDAWDGDTPKFEFFNPALFEGKSPVLDVFFSLPDETENQLDVRASFLASAIDEIIEDASISSQMRTLLIPCLSVLFRRPGSTLADLQRFMIDEKNTDLVEDGKRLKNVSQAVFFEGGFQSKQYEPTKRSLYTRLQSLLNSNSFRRCTSSRQTSQAFLDLDACLNGSKSIIFNLSKSNLGDDVTKALGRLVIAQIKALAYLRGQTSKHQRKRTYIVIDEAHNFVGESIAEILTELRKYGCRLIFANQIVGQEASTGTKDVFLSNTGVKIAGRNSEKSIAILSAEMGADKEQMRKLTQGQFMAKVKDNQRHTEPFVFRADSSLVGGRRSFTGNEFSEKKRAFLSIYSDNDAIDRDRRKSYVVPTGNDPDYVAPSDESGKANLKPKFKI
jgi:DNA helicase HerA-like ATPase